MNRILQELGTSLSVATPLSNPIETNLVFPSCPVRVKGRNLLAELILLDVIDFDVIFGMDWRSQHFATLDCRGKVVRFNILEMQNLNSKAITVFLPPF
ncbi:hypothetical protein M5689_006520 [Euphorbia peplus]|nr:hypothetical protein M5689_006520 [Euphorbia peplus]